MAFAYDDHTEGKISLINMSAIYNGEKFSTAKDAIRYVVQYKDATSFCNFQEFCGNFYEKIALSTVSAPTFGTIVLLCLFDDPVLAQHRHIRLDRYGKPFV